jgi:hypothetical protein
MSICKHLSNHPLKKQNPTLEITFKSWILLNYIIYLFSTIHEDYNIQMQILLLHHLT